MEIGADRLAEKKMMGFRLSGFHRFRLRHIAKKHGRNMTNMVEHMIDVEYVRCKELEKKKLNY